MSWATEAASTSQVPIATLDQGLEDDFQLLPGEDETSSPDDQKWTCKKCTLVNSAQSLTCEACCGSKLKSLSTTADMTLRKGEFWSCSKCTLKNPLTLTACKVCQTKKNLDVPVMSARNPSPRHGSSKNAHKTNFGGNNNLPKELMKLERINLKSDIDTREFHTGFSILSS